MSMSERGKKGAEARWGRRRRVRRGRRARSMSPGWGDEEYHSGDENRESGFGGVQRRGGQGSGPSLSERGRMGGQARRGQPWTYAALGGPGRGRRGV